VRKVRRLAGFAVTVAALALVLAPPASAGSRDHAPRVTKVKVTEAIVYGKARVNRPVPGSFDLLMDLYQPVTKARGHGSKRARHRGAGSKPLLPAVVVIHGGGFSGGSRLGPDFDKISRALAKRGMVVANIDYRVIPQDPVLSQRVAPAAAAFPDVPIFNAMVAAIDDTLTAIDWLRARAEKLRIDKKRLGLVGESAGAITADHVAYVLDDIGIKAPRVSFVGDLWGGIFFDVGAHAAQLEKGEAPLFSVHGDADGVVPVFLDDRLVARARKVGVPVEYHRVAGGGHGSVATGFFTREVRPGQTAFDRMLKLAQRYLW
jgi:acetyl esterase/lipase